MTLTISEEQAMVAAGVRAFVTAELQPHEKLVEERDEVPDELFRELQQKAIRAGYYAINMPEEYGGGGLGQSLRCMAEFEFGRTSRALAVICNRPAPILRLYRCADRHLPQTGHHRRALGMLCPDRTRCRLGCREYLDPRGA